MARSRLCGRAPCRSDFTSCCLCSSWAGTLQTPPPQGSHAVLAFPVPPLDRPLARELQCFLPTPAGHSLSVVPIEPTVSTLFVATGPLVLIAPAPLCLRYHPLLHFPVTFMACFSMSNHRSTRAGLAVSSLSTAVPQSLEQGVSTLRC